MCTVPDEFALALRVRAFSCATGLYSVRGADETAMMLAVSSALYVPVVSPSATAAWLAQSQFQRVVPSDSVQSQRLADLTVRLGWQFLTGAVHIPQLGC